MKKYISPVIMAIIVGFFISKYLFNQYHDPERLFPVFSEKENILFIQQGVYSTIDSMKSNTKDFNNYIYSIINDKYYVFIGITNEEANATKIKDYFKSRGYNTYVKEFTVSNKDFNDELKQYDILLSKTKDTETVKTIINQVLTKYNELVLKSGEN